MAEMITAEDVRQMRKAHPEAAVVCYVNSPAEVKAQSDICCTSANGIAVVNSLQEDEIIFVPDRNLAAYVAKHTKKKIIPWHGYCYVHEGFTVADVELKRRLHPHASLLVHPECRPEVIELADYVYSTSGMARHVKGSKDSEFIIGTETGMLYRLWKDNPNAVFVPLSDGAVCADMKKTTLESVLISLERLEPRIRLPPSVASPARRAIARMLEI
jgi:quinolinate synthase